MPYTIDSSVVDISWHVPVMNATNCQYHTQTMLHHTLPITYS